MKFKRMGFKSLVGEAPPHKELAHLALQQIHDHRYYHEIEEITVLYGVAFNLKNPK